MRVIISNRIATEQIGNKLWVLTKPFNFEVEGLFYKIEPGFVFDGNSNVRALWSICPIMGGGYSEAGLVHDYLYSLDSADILTRKQADQVHREIAKKRGVNFVRRFLVYWALRLCGKKNYKKCYSIDKITEETCYIKSVALNTAMMIKKGYQSWNPTS